MEDERPGVMVAALSGPNLAGEIAAGLPAATTVASSHQDVALRVQALLQQRTFRVYTSPDVAGVELAGAMKNVIALAAGICDGLGLGDNAKSSIITRGLAELVRLGTLLGGETRTFYGLAGIGDIIATCSSQQSRNHTAGVLLAAGEGLDDLRARNLTAEGVPTVEAVHRYAEANDIDLPITAEVYRVVYLGKAAREAMVDLMTRERKAE
jgi:glycerol-3-phosphate dehydrogenase (NAD(P)+)